MPRASAPIHYTSTPAAKEVFGAKLPSIATAAFLEIGRIARGYAIHHHQFMIEGSLVQVASRVKQSGVVEIEIDVGQPLASSRTFTQEDAERAMMRRRVKARR